MKMCLILCDTLRADRVKPWIMPEVHALAMSGVDYRMFWGDGGTTKDSLPFFLCGERDFKASNSFPAYLQKAEEYTRIIHSNAVIPSYGYDKGFLDVNDLGMERTPVKETIRRTLRNSGVWAKTRPLRQALRGGAPVELPYKRAEFITRMASDALDIIESGFIWVQLMDPHIPYDPPGITKMERLEGKRLYDKIIKWVRDPLVTFTELERERLEYFYNLECSYMDGEIGKLTSRHPDTVFIVTSDHGDAFGLNYTFSHCPGYMGMVPGLGHLPFIVNGPGVRETTLDNYNASNNVGTTILQAFGIDQRIGYGRSFWPEVVV